MTPTPRSNLSARRVAVVGDGPAGSALAHAIDRRGIDVVLIGPDRPWEATYSMWVDDLDGVSSIAGHDIWLHRFSSVAVCFETRRQVDREYGVVDNDRLRSVLREGVEHLRCSPGTEQEARDLTGADIVIDATGWPSVLQPVEADAARRVWWQTAFGVVLATPPAGLLGCPTIMDFSPADDGGDQDSALPPTFAYSLPVADGWLVEETVLAGPAMDPDRLVGRLATRLGLSVEALLAAAVRTERVRIPMGAPIAPDRGATGGLRFGAAAGMIHTATGYSVAGSLRAAERVAGAIGSSDVGAAIWPTPLRRSRHLHDYGLDVLVSMDVRMLRRFFETFFELPVGRWPAYLRIDTGPRELALVMAKMFIRADWRLRIALLKGNPLRFVRLVRP